MVFILSKLYQILPERVKNHKIVIESVQRFNNNNKFKEIETHYMMLDLIFNSCEIKATGTMRDKQLLITELLKLFDYICKKNNIEYWMDYGTLLGATRHKGFVPWDDDLDLSMMKEDYNRFIEIFPKEIEEIDELKDKIVISKLTKPHENYPEGSNEIDLMNHGMFNLFFQFAYKKPFVHFDIIPKEYILDEGLTPTRNDMQTKLQVELRDKIASGDWTFDEGMEIQRQKMKFTYEKTEHISDSIDGLHNNIHNRIFETKTVFPLETKIFEGVEFPCPYDSNTYLSLIYGPEYMHIPRITHDHITTDFIKGQYDDNQKAIDEGFKDAINLVKSVNERLKIEE